MRAVVFWRKSTESSSLAETLNRNAIANVAKPSPDGGWLGREEVTCQTVPHGNKLQDQSGSRFRLGQAAHLQELCKRAESTT